jgi:hypothetical protein
MKKSMRAVATLIATASATAALLAAQMSGAGVASALPAGVGCHVGGGGELWCEDWETGQSREEAPGGSYPYQPYCPPYVTSVQCGD